MNNNCFFSVFIFLKKIFSGFVFFSPQSISDSHFAQTTRKQQMQQNKPAVLLLEKIQVTSQKVTNLLCKTVRSRWLLNDIATLLLSCLHSHVLHLVMSPCLQTHFRSTNFSKIQQERICIFYSEIPFACHLALELCSAFKSHF